MQVKNSQSNRFVHQKVMAIIQLCFAFSLMIWHITQPFMGEYYSLRSRMILYEYVMGNTEIRNKIQTSIQSLKKLFENLSPEDKNWLIKDYQQLQAYANRSPLIKIGDGLKHFLRDMPPFEQAWIFFSIIIAVLVLLKREGVRQAVWIVPIIVLVYIVDNQLTGKSSVILPDHHLFPSEEIIVHQYLKEPLAQGILEQKEQLEKGWNRYLIENWSTNYSENAESQIDEGKFNFSLARLRLLRNQNLVTWLHSYHKKLSWITLFLYAIWNGLFGWIISRQ